MKPYHLLLKFFHQIPKGLVLDIGSGRGRNSFFLAKKGFEVEAIDIDQQSINEIKKTIQENKLSIKARCLDLREFQFTANKYSLILAIQSLNFIKKSDFEKIIEKIKDSLIKGGFFIISAFTISDPSFKKFKKKSQPIEENTFYSKKTPNWWHFFKKNELKKYFQSGFEILYYLERIVKDKKPLPHTHSIVEMVVRKNSDSHHKVRS
jgi:tellurite methyltransferase